MELNNSFANVLKKMRQEKGLTQTEMALQSNFHRTYISQMERGLKSPTLNTLYTLANVFGISLTQLINAVEQEMQK